MAEEDFDGWAFLELMGYRRLAGQVRTVQLGGTPMLRIDIVGTEKDAVATQYYAPSALYCLTPTTEDGARSWSARNAIPEPQALGTPLDDFEDEHPF